MSFELLQMTTAIASSVGLSVAAWKISGRVGCLSMIAVWALANLVTHLIPCWVYPQAASNVFYGFVIVFYLVVTGVVVVPTAVFLMGLSEVPRD